MKKIKILGFACAALVLTIGCSRGRPSERPPIHPNPNMDNQEKVVAQDQDEFFANNMGMRKPVEGTMPLGHLKENGRGPVYVDRFDIEIPVEDREEFFTGLTTEKEFVMRSKRQGIAKIQSTYSKEKEGVYVRKSPLPFTEEVLERGRERYNIYCAVCHGETGVGGETAEVMKRGYAVKPPNFHDERILNMSDGEIYHSIVYGVNNGTMPSYAYQISVEDRWAIIGYLRALQLSQNTDEELYQKSVKKEDSGKN
ncbi:MAG: cytochrome c [Lentisphaeria bacterium]|nr:cytochrome c [Lentisphaeria bacterium]